MTKEQKIYFNIGKNYSWLSDDAKEFLAFHENFHRVEYNNKVADTIGNMPPGPQRNTAHDIADWGYIKNLNPDNIDVLERGYKEILYANLNINDLKTIAAKPGKLDAFDLEVLNKMFDKTDGMAEWLVVDPGTAKTVLSKLENIPKLKSLIKEIGDLSEIYENILKVV